LSPLGLVANSGHEGRGYTDTEKVDSPESGNQACPPSRPTLDARVRGNDDEHVMDDSVFRAVSEAGIEARPPSPASD